MAESVAARTTHLLTQAKTEPAGATRAPGFYARKVLRAGERIGEDGRPSRGPGSTHGISVVASRGGLVALGLADSAGLAMRRASTACYRVFRCLLASLRLCGISINPIAE